jgi:quinol monooxygenase YgiN
MAQSLIAGEIKKEKERLMTIKVVAKQTLKDGKREEALAIFRELIELTRKEQGCIAYDLHESVDSPNVFAIIEAWETKEALDAHMGSEHFKRLIPKLGSLTEAGSSIDLYTQII